MARDASNKSACGRCGAGFTPGMDLFCASCGNRVGNRVSIQVSQTMVEDVVESTVTIAQGAVRSGEAPALALLGDAGEVVRTYLLDRGEAILGRGEEADIRFADDHFMSPLHARIDRRNGSLWLRDLGSRNETWIFLDEPAKLLDGDMMLIGSQVIRFRRLGYPGPHPPEADATRRMGSTIPTVDVALLQQVRADGSVRDTFHLSPGRSVLIGRTTGDWLFPYDQTMSGRHAEIRTEDSEFFAQDAGSRNGVAMSIRGERELKPGQRLLLGDQILRVDRV